MLLPPVRRRLRNDIALSLAFTGGTLLGASAMVAVAMVLGGLLSPLPVAVRVALFVALAGYATIVGLLGLDHRLPENGRQIGLGVVSAGRPGGAFRFGTMMGTSLFTFIPSAAAHVFAASVVLSLIGWVTMLCAAIGFGLGRGLGMIARAFSRDRLRFERGFQEGVFVLKRLVVPAVAVLVLGSGAWQ